MDCLQRSGSEGGVRRGYRCSLWNAQRPGHAPGMAPELIEHGCLGIREPIAQDGSTGNAILEAASARQPALVDQRKLATRGRDVKDVKPGAAQLRDTGCRSRRRNALELMVVL